MNVLIYMAKGTWQIITLGILRWEAYPKLSCWTNVIKGPYK